MRQHPREPTGSWPRPIVLVLRALGLGDALTGIPALRGIRQAWPDHRLIIACPPELGRWLTGLGVVDGVVPATGLDPIVDLPRPDIAVNLHGRGPRSHEVLRMTKPGRLLGFACPAAGFIDGPRWDDTAHEVDRWCTLARWVGGECSRRDLRLTTHFPADLPAPIVVHPGASAAARRWPVCRWRRVVGELSAGSSVVVTGSSSEQAVCAAVCQGSAATCLAGRTPLPRLAELVAGARAVVSGDTGVAHLATAFGIPSVTLFGPVHPALWGPAIDPDIHRCLWHGGDTGDDDTDRGDPHGDRLDPRLETITVAEVLAAVRSLDGVGIS